MAGVQERAELEAWRERVRAKYEEVGYGAQIPPDLPRQLQVGQRVTARHPVTRQIHDGDILTTAPKYYRLFLSPLPSEITHAPCDSCKCLRL